MSELPLVYLAFANSQDAHLALLKAESRDLYQALAPLADFCGNHPVHGAWMVNHEAAGLGIREDSGLITGNLSRFVPHLFWPK